MNNKPVKGKLVLCEKDGTPTGDELVFYYNPTEYSVSKSNAWKPNANKGHNVQELEFGGGQNRQLQMELLLDVSAPSANRGAGQQSSPRLQKTLNTLLKMMMVADSGGYKGTNSGMSEPPRLRLVWGQFTPEIGFYCCMTNCSVKYTMFNEDGVPIRATANLTLLETYDPLPPTNPTSLGEPGRRLHSAVDGERLDWIAYQEYGSAREWRRIAEANHLQDVRDIRPGTVLVIPPY